MHVLHVLMDQLPNEYNTRKCGKLLLLIRWKWRVCVISEKRRVLTCQFSIYTQNFCAYVRATYIPTRSTRTAIFFFPHKRHMVCNEQLLPRSCNCILEKFNIVP